MDDAALVLIVLLLLSGPPRAAAARPPAGEAPRGAPPPSLPSREAPPVGPDRPPAALPPRGMRAGTLTVTLPMHLSGIERTFAGPDDVRSRLEPAIDPALAKLRRRAGRAIAIIGAHAVRVEPTDYGYLATVTAQISFDPRKRTAITTAARAIVLEDADVRTRTRGGARVRIVP